MMMRYLPAVIAITTGILLASCSAAFVPSSHDTTSSTKLSGPSSTTTLFMAGNGGGRRRNWSTSHGIGKDWEGHWERKYGELMAERSWNERPNLEYAENPRLWNWLNIQKENMRRDAMRQDRRDKLAALGYSTRVEPLRTSLVPTPDDDVAWKLQFMPPSVTNANNKSPINNKKESWEQRWDNMYDKLRAFKDQFGHTSVPRSHQDQKLANWVHIQRENLKRGVMKQDRRQRLLDLGLQAP